MTILGGGLYKLYCGMWSNFIEIVDTYLYDHTGVKKPE